MKIIILAVAAIFLISCSNSPYKNWGRFGAEADSINAKLDSIYTGRGITLGDSILINRLDKLAGISDRPCLKALACYWKASALNTG